MSDPVNILDLSDFVAAPPMGKFNVRPKTPAELAKLPDVVKSEVEDEPEEPTAVTAPTPRLATPRQASLRESSAPTSTPTPVLSYPRHLRVRNSQVLHDFLSAQGAEFGRTPEEHARELLFLILRNVKEQEAVTAKNP